MSRRELLSNTTNNPEYITDGLVVWYDGINNSGEGHLDYVSTWKDLSGNDNDLVLSAAAITQENCISKLATGYILGSNNTFDGTIGTIEMVASFENKTSMVLRTKLYNNNERGIYLTSRGISPKSGQATYVCDIWYPTQVSFDYINGIYQINGEVVTTSSLDTWSNGVNNSLELLSYPGYNGIGTIYSFRIYNRGLTDQERLNNLIIDRERFGLNE